MSTHLCSTNLLAKNGNSWGHATWLRGLQPRLRWLVVYSKLPGIHGKLKQELHPRGTTPVTTVWNLQPKCWLRHSHLGHHSEALDLTILWECPEVPISNGKGCVVGNRGRAQWGSVEHGWRSQCSQSEARIICATKLDKSVHGLVISNDLRSWHPTSFLLCWSKVFNWACQRATRILATVPLVAKSHWTYLRVWHELDDK